MNLITNSLSTIRSMSFLLSELERITIRGRLLRSSDILSNSNKNTNPSTIGILISRKMISGKASALERLFLRYSRALLPEFLIMILLQNLLSSNTRLWMKLSVSLSSTNITLLIGAELIFIEIFQRLTFTPGKNLSQLINNFSTLQMKLSRKGSFVTRRLISDQIRKANHKISPPPCF